MKDLSYITIRISANEESKVGNCNVKEEFIVRGSDGLFDKFYKAFDRYRNGDIYRNQSYFVSHLWLLKNKNNESDIGVTLKCLDNPNICIKSFKEEYEI